MKFIHLSICLLILVSLNSCRKVNSPSTKQNKLEKSILENYPEMSIPYTDSTSFENFDFRKKSLTKAEVENLKLISVFSNLNYSKEAKLFVKHRITLSDKFNSVVAICVSENEIYTALINYNNKLEPINYKEIAYDEIAESCQRKISEISKKKLEISESDFCNGLVTKENFEIENNGKIRASR